MARETTKLTRDIIAVQIPDGTLCSLTQNTEVAINYILDGSYIVDSDGLTYRITGQDADALGKPKLSFPLDTKSNLPIEDKIWNVLHTCFDPEIPVNLVNLGLIYNVEAQKNEQHKYLINIRMTFTSPGCSMGPIIVEDIKTKTKTILEVQEVNVEIVFDPPWDRSMMSEQAKLDLGLF